MTDSEHSREDIRVDITLVDILDYVGDSVRPVREGCAVFDAGHVVCIGYTDRTDYSVAFCGYVLQSSNPGLIPHKTNLTISTNVSKWVCICSCKAGTSRCKHIIACLLSLNRSGSASYLSCTDTVQAWGITKSERTVPWGAKPVDDLCCVNHPKKIICTDNTLEHNILVESFNRVLMVAKESAIYKHRLGRSLNTPPIDPNRAEQSRGNGEDFCTKDDLRSLLNGYLDVVVADAPFNTTAEKDWYTENVAVDIGRIIEIAEETQEQSTNYWKIQRKIRITASSCYQLYTYLFNKNPDWDKKISRYWSASNIKTAAIKYGKDNEPKAYACYKRKRNPLVKKCGLVVKSDENWFAASPDGVDPLTNVILEIKCPVSGESGTLVDIEKNEAVKKYLRRCPITNQLKLNNNHAYYCQVQLNMWALNCKNCDFVLYSVLEDDFLLIEVDFDKLFVENVVNGLKGLYFTLMLKFLVPQDTAKISI
nr:uncharacterized protein LOC109417047 isoform X2 [Aedes albopictus]